MAEGTLRSDRERVEVMLSVLPWLAATGGAPLAQAASKFGVDPEQLREDLMTVFYDVEPEVGAHSMVEVQIDESDDDFVSIRLPGSFEDPPELDRAEALALLAAATALLGHPGTDLVLAPAVEKLHAALGVAGTQTVRVDLGAGDPAVRTLLLEALEAGNVVELEYFSWGSDEVSSRRVDPWSLRSIRGHWYLTGWCHDREAVRHFRLDRVIGAAGTSDPLSHPAPGEPEEPLREGTGVTTVVVELPALDAWRVDSLPARSFEDSGDTVRVTLEVLSEAWLDRLLVGLGPGAEVRDSTGGDLASRRAAVAQRILDARYPPGGEEAASR